jgi:adenosylmethionine---8-amino-7-oxononanoate aminotransferase
MSVAERNAFTTAFNPFLFEVKRLPLPHANNIETVKLQLQQWAHQGDIAAFIFEPLVQGAAGMQMYDAVYLDELIALAKENNIICIADEVMTGFGRTGKNFAVDHLQQQPDIICLSKGITGGFMPLGVTICIQQIFDAFYDTDKLKTFFHGHSYTANPLACAAANASMQLLDTQKCREQIQKIADSHIEFKHKIVNHVFVKEIRQTGTIIAIELKTKENASYFNGVQKNAYNYYLNKGVFLRPLGNVVYIMPPYCITEQELKQVYKVITDSLDYLLNETL